MAPLPSEHVANSQAAYATALEMLAEMTAARDALLAAAISAYTFLDGPRGNPAVCHPLRDAIGAAHQPPRLAGVHFVVFGTPEPKGSTKNLPTGRVMAALRRGRGYTIHSVGELLQSIVTTSDNDKLQSFAARVTFEATLAQRRVKVLLAGPVSVRLRFYLQEPQRLPAQRLGHCITKPDTDKLCRAVKDALTGVLYADDGQVVHLSAWKYYAAHADAQRVEIDVAALGPMTDPTPLFT